MNITDQMRRKLQRSVRLAAEAINAGDFEAKKKHLDDASFWRALLLEAGEPVEPEHDEIERCAETEDMFR